MKITCQACAAKYTIADEKVLGKIVKIRCKKCGATIVVNGNDPSAGAAAPEAPRAFDYAGQGGQGDQWTINVADGDQRTMTDAEIAGAYQAGLVNDETFCWKDGMTDWLPIREVEQLYAACTATRAHTAPQGMSHEHEGVTKIQESGPSLFGGGPQPTPYVPPRPAAGPDANGGGAMYAQAGSAARRTGGRAPAADLFSGAAQAGSEEDVMTSAPSGMPQAHEDDAKLTGQRNENSVLFSLNALTSNAPAKGKGAMPATSEASGLIDIRQLSAQIGMGDDKKKSRIDDIMNLAGGGAFSPALNAPVLSAPPLEEYAPPPEAGATGAISPVRSKNRPIIIGAIAGGALFIALAIGGAVMLTHKGSEADKDTAAASASAASTVSTATPSASLALNTPPAPTDTSTAAATATAPPPGTTTAAAPTTAPTTTKTTAPKDPPTPTTTPTTPPTATTAAPTATPTTPPAPGADQPFNMGEAKARLASIAGSVQGCKKGDASGSGRAVVTFAPSGNVASVTVSGLDGAPPGMSSCVASRFRGAKVPPFSGSPFSVSKSFSIN